MAFDAVTDIVSIRSKQDIDVENFKWETLPTLTDYNGKNTIIVDNYLYAIGGRLTSSSSVYSTYCRRLNLDAEGSTWETLPNFPTQRLTTLLVYKDNYIYSIGGMITNGARSSSVYKLQIKPTVGAAWQQFYVNYDTDYARSFWPCSFGIVDMSRTYVDYDLNYAFINNSYQNVSSTSYSIQGIYALSLTNYRYYYLSYPHSISNIFGGFIVVHDNYLYVGGGAQTNNSVNTTNKVYRLNLDILNELDSNANYLNNIIWEEITTLSIAGHKLVYFYIKPYVYYSESIPNSYSIRRLDLNTFIEDDIGVPNLPNITYSYDSGWCSAYDNTTYVLGIYAAPTTYTGIPIGYKLRTKPQGYHTGWNADLSIKAYDIINTELESTLDRDNSVVTSSPINSIITDGFAITTEDGADVTVLSPRPNKDFSMQTSFISSPLMLTNTTPSGTVTASNSGISTSDEHQYSVAGEYYRGMFQIGHDLWYSTSTAPGWLQYDFGYSFYPTGYRIGHIGIQPNANIAKDIILQGSNDGINFIDLDNQYNLNLCPGTMHYFKLPIIPTKYRYYRLYVSATQGAAAVAISNFQVFGFALEDLANFRGDTLFTSLSISKDIQATFPIVNFFATHNLISPFSLFAAQAIQEGMGPPGNYILDKYAPLSSLVFNLTKDWTGYLSTNVATLEATLNSGEIFRSLINVPMSVLSGRIVFNIEFNSNITIPIATIDSTYYQDNIFTINVTLPTSYANSTLENLSAAIQGALTDLITVVLNTKTLGHTTYTNYNFNTIVKFNNKYYGCDKTQGIFELTGDTDNNEQIDSTITTGISDYLIDEQKRVLDFYLNTRYDGSINIKTIADEVSEEVHTLDDSYKQGIHAERIKLSKGLRGKQWQINITNNNGSDFEIDRTSILISKGSRRI